MATSLDADGMRLRWEVVPFRQPSEIAVFTMYTGKRDVAQYGALCTEMEDFLASIAGITGGILTDYTLDTRLFLDLWQEPILNADGWGTAHQQYVSAASGTSSPMLPPQVAAVVTRDTFDGELPVPRRKNRSYIGPLTDNYLEVGGTMSVAGATALLTRLQTFHTSLQGVPVASGTPADYDGLCNVSYRGTGVPLGGAQIAKSDRARVGTVLDTQRRRRNALDEGYQTVPLS